MKVFKFGGASLQHAAGINQFTHIIAQHQAQKLVIVVSAMGKTTQSLENIFEQKVNNQPYVESIETVYLFHQAIVEDLFGNAWHQVQQELIAWKTQLTLSLQVSYPRHKLDELYSSLVAYGELIASRIVYAYLQLQHIPCQWLDARKYIKTDHGFKDARIAWDITQSLVQQTFLPLLAQHNLLVTQGFISSNQAAETTTLGKEGSDFTGAILANSLGAESLTIWKDVPGIMNADPKYFQATTKFEQLSYTSMATMAFYGAQVVHPQTIWPLAVKDIPLYVKSFYDWQATGTVIVNGHLQLEKPIYMLRTDQCFVRLRVSNFTFLDEYQLSKIFQYLWQVGIKANMVERSVYAIGLCLNHDFVKLQALLKSLSKEFTVECQNPVSLLTSIQPADEVLQQLLQDKTILTEQYTQECYQVVFKEK